MKGRFGVIIVFVLAYAAFNLYQQRSTPTMSLPVRQAIPSQSFQCDGRQHCSQMTSCAEAKFFIQNCPNTKMDGDKDGVPCERQWCSR